MGRTRPLTHPPPTRGVTGRGGRGAPERRSGKRRNRRLRPGKGRHRKQTISLKQKLTGLLRTVFPGEGGHDPPKRGFARPGVEAPRLRAPHRPSGPCTQLLNR